MRRKNGNNKKEKEEIKRTKKSRRTGNETLAYLKQKAAKYHEVRMLETENQNEKAKAQRLLLEQYHHQQQQQQQQQTQQHMLLHLAESTAGNDSLI